jgi:toxin ParE1/3/4
VKPIRFGGEAEEEFLQVASWYEDQRESLGLEFVAEVRAAQLRVQERPAAYRFVPNVPVELRARRCPIRRFPYTLIFIELTDEIRVIAVAHNRRRPGYWRKRP